MKHYGVEHFVWGVIEEVEESYLKERESYWMNHYNTISEGYNNNASFVEDKYSRKLDYQRNWIREKLSNETPEQRDKRLARRRELRRKPHDSLV
ncbi:GIY-YIG catalytic domain-containing protein [Synechococcus phage ACG-2014f]|uniref:GIY-YIG catalytic domain-containing protein n=1 Tax=Synechococcus phage ACG-2014f TaxID=1493511 RepID=A0A0E3HLX3_9CAUD|nr:GIY-YIG catalytic domain-containing protein [Synechococcus phage ACG-2014f]